jgi:hypothetical protein
MMARQIAPYVAFMICLILSRVQDSLKKYLSSPFSWFNWDNRVKLFNIKLFSTIDKNYSLLLTIKSHNHCANDIAFKIHHFVSSIQTFEEETINSSSLLTKQNNYSLLLAIGFKSLPECLYFWSREFIHSIRLYYSLSLIN